MRNRLSFLLLSGALLARVTVASDERSQSPEITLPMRSIACPDRPVDSLQAFPTGSRIVALTPNECLILDASSGIVARTEGLQPTCCALSPSGKEIAIASDESSSTYRSGPLLIRDGGRVSRNVGGTVHILSTMTGESLRSFPAASYKISALAYTPDGKDLATASARVTQKPDAGGGWTATATEGEVVLWDPTNGIEKGRFMGQESFVNALAFSATGRLLAAAGYRPQHVMLWDVMTRRQAGLLTHSCREIKCLAFAKHDAVVVGASYGGGLQIWDIETKTHLATISTKECKSIAVSPDGSRILAAEDGGGARLWSLDTHACLATWTKEQTGWAMSVAFTSDGKYLAIGGDDGVVRIWSESAKGSSQPK